DTSSCTNVVITGIDELNNATFAIYPNPSNGVVTIKAATAGFYTITNELGQTIQSFNLNGSNNYKLTLDKLNPGIYFVVGVSNNKTIQQKIIVTQ
ncbi:MAG TPA: T9SS type A sorting domain-containing protein, partial [Vicingus sp.]|nr:T9SS type A sorting domain-containing protein [Vicingus sp.]